MDRFWVKQYPPGTPAEIDPSEYSSLKALIDRSCEQFAAHTAFIQMEQRLSYEEVDCLSNRFAAWLQRLANSAHQFFASRHIEVVKNIGEQHIIVAAAHLHLKRASGAHAKAIGHAKFLRVFLRHAQHVRPIQGCDTGLGVAFRNGNAEQAMPRGNIENALVAAQIDGLTKRFANDLQRGADHGIVA